MKLARLLACFIDLLGENFAYFLKEDDSIDRNHKTATFTNY